MGKKRKRGQLTEADIWDDSALLRSWQDALDEYQLYHSIHAKGENVEEILQQAESDDSAKAKDFPPAMNGHTSLDGDMEEREVDEVGGISSGPIADVVVEKVSIPSIKSQQSKSHFIERDQVHDAASMNQGQILENIKMSYWWAGYYSGLSDAKQAGNQPSER